MTTSNLNIVADENIPFVREAFETIGTVKLVSGRAVRPTLVRDAHILLVRSVTKVNPELLKNSQIEFVGTATAGLDHIDTEFLRARGIAFASAQGGNATSVAEYVVSALINIARRHEITLTGKSIGIIGVGHIGQIVKIKAEALGLTVVLNDPPLGQKTGDKAYRPLQEVLACDVVTLHVPLSFEGPFKTFHLFNESMLTRLNPSAILLNTSRGEVIDSQALIKRIQKQNCGAVVLDVWECEPHINWELFKLATFGTPHIAGYSLDGKAKGIYLIYQALCQHLRRTPTWNPSRSLPVPTISRIAIEPKGKTSEQFLGDLITKIYDLEADYFRMAELLNLYPEQRPFEFDRLRKNYPVRREFHNTTVCLLSEKPELLPRVEQLGFKVEGEIFSDTSRSHR